MGAPTGSVEVSKLDRPARDRLLQAFISKPRDYQGCLVLLGLLLDLLPQLRVRLPGVLGILFRRERGRHVAHQRGVDLPHLRLLARRLLLDSMSPLAEKHFDPPRDRPAGRFTPQKRGRRNIRRKDGARLREVDEDRRSVLGRALSGAGRSPERRLPTGKPHRPKVQQREAVLCPFDLFYAHSTPIVAVKRKVHFLVGQAGGPRRARNGARPPRMELQSVHGEG